MVIEILLILTFLFSLSTNSSHFCICNHELQISSMHDLSDFHESLTTFPQFYLKYSLPSVISIPYFVCCDDIITCTPLQSYFSFSPCTWTSSSTFFIKLSSILNTNSISFFQLISSLFLLNYPSLACHLIFCCSIMVTHTLWIYCTYSFHTSSQLLIPQTTSLFHHCMLAIA